VIRLGARIARIREKRNRHEVKITATVCVGLAASKQPAAW
jgi:hypothetical protein